MNAELKGRLSDALSEITTAIYVGTETDRKVALRQLLEVWTEIFAEVET